MEKNEVKIEKTTPFTMAKIKRLKFNNKQYKTYIRKTTKQHA